MSAFFSFVGGGIYTLLAFILALSVIVFVHEFGHYIVGRWSGIKAEVFSIGFGPAIWARTDKHGTRWQIACLPLGGYVRFLGDANPASFNSDAPPRPGSLAGAPLWARAATVAAGPLVNFLFAVGVFAALIMTTGIPRDLPVIKTLYDLPGGSGGLQIGDEIQSINGAPISNLAAIFLYDKKDADQFVYKIKRKENVLVVNGPPVLPARIAGMSPGSAAMDAKLKIGDVFLELDGQKLTRFDQLSSIIQNADGRLLTVKIWRKGEVFETTLVPKKRDLPNGAGGFERRWLLGVSGGLFFEPPKKYPNPLKAIEIGMGQTWQVVTSSLRGIKGMIVGELDHCNLQGPVGIAKTSGDAASLGGHTFLIFLAVLSAAIGFINLFPIPVLDGGHLLLLGFEAIFRKKPSHKVMYILFLTGIVFILTLMFFALWNDFICP